MSYYDRYQRFRQNGQVRLIPNIKINNSGSDIFVQYNRANMRLDSLSYKYYGDADYAWLILLSNPSYGSLEFDIPDGVSLRIPYPLSSAINRYEKAVEKL